MTKLCDASEFFFSKIWHNVIEIFYISPKVQNTSLMIALHVRIDTESKILLENFLSQFLTVEDCCNLSGYKTAASRMS